MEINVVPEASEARVLTRGSRSAVLGDKKRVRSPPPVPDDIFPIPEIGPILQNDAGFRAIRIVTTTLLHGLEAALALSPAAIRARESGLAARGSTGPPGVSPALRSKRWRVRSVSGSVASSRLPARLLACRPGTGLGAPPALWLVLASCSPGARFLLAWCSLPARLVLASCSPGRLSPTSPVPIKSACADACGLHARWTWYSASEGRACTQRPIATTVESVMRSLSSA